MAYTASNEVSNVLVERLLREHEAGRLRYQRHTRPRKTADVAVRYLFDVPDGGRRVFDVQQTWAWLHGREACEAAADLPRLDLDVTELDPIRPVLEGPLFVDQVRLQIRVAMEHNGIGIVDLARRTGVTRKTIADSLRFGHAEVMSMAVAGAMWQALPGDWPRRQILPPLAADDLEPVTALRDAQPEPAGVVRARAAAIMHEAQLVRYVGPLDPNKVLRASKFTVEMAGLGQRDVLAPVLIAWLTGVADGAGDSVTAAALTPSGRGLAAEKG